MRRREVKPDRLALIDAKTARWHILLSEAAHDLLNSLAGMVSDERVFPAIREQGL